VRSVPATLLAFLLLLLLTVTTPTGTGDGVHNSLLLHPLFAHTHLINGRIVSHQASEQAPIEQAAQPANGPAIGAEAGAAAAAGVALSPTVPLQDFTIHLGQPYRLTTSHPAQPMGQVEAPPEKPPTSAA
jgi:hypothetical protein